MKSFLAVFGHLVLGVLDGFDRLVFRGHLRQLSYPHGMDCYLSANRVLLKDFDDHAREQTKTLISASLAEASRLNRPTPYLNSSKISKEQEARRIATRDQISSGLICVFKSVEPCWTFEVHRNRERKMLELQGKQGKCAFLYHYYLHPEFGFMHARIQTWFPYAMQVCLNGREWLARQLDQAGLNYERRDNKFMHVEDFAKAQALLDQQVRTAWPKCLDEIARTIHPAHPQLLGRLPVKYYWSTYQSEWASDYFFRRRADLEQLYLPWVRHALLTYDSSQVMRFLGRVVPASGRVHRGFQGEVSSDVQEREEGVRIKHWVDDNALKMYDSLFPETANLRIETTINDPSAFRVYRQKENDPEGEMAWREMRRGVADLHRRAEVSQAANDRYAQALTAVTAKTPLKEWAEPLSRRVPALGNPQRKERGLNPMAGADAALLRAVADVKFAVNGLRNRDLVAMLYDRPASTEAERRRRSGRVTRQIRLLRAHGILRKIPKSHRYQITPDGRKAILALQAARDANTEELTGKAA